MYCQIYGKHEIQGLKAITNTAPAYQNAQINNEDVEFFNKCMEINKEEHSTNPKLITSTLDSIQSQWRSVLDIANDKELSLDALLNIKNEIQKNKSVLYAQRIGKGAGITDVTKEYIDSCLNIVQTIKK